MEHVKVVAGDTISVKALVLSEEPCDIGYKVLFHESSVYQIIKREDINDVIHYNIQVGDRIEWKDGQRRFGEVIAVEPDTTNSTTWLWVKEDNKWPRITLDMRVVKRILD